jgi:hypothetical protein
MDSPKVCYVSMSFGQRRDQQDRVIDYDRLYREVIRPAVEASGLTCQRADEFTGAAVISQTLFTAILTADVMLAEVSSSAHVMYELGVRHATNPRPTIVLASADTRLPYNLTFPNLLRYAVRPDGEMDGSEQEQFRQKLTAEIEAGLRGPANYSPLFALFPELEVRLPQQASISLPSTIWKAAKQALQADPILRRQTNYSSLRVAEEEAVQGPEADPTAVLAIVKGYQEVSAWDDLIRFADTLSPELRGLPEIEQRVALALNRRAKPGDRDRAAELVSNLIERTGGDSETFGILGRIHKDLFRETGSPEHWQKAYNAYLAGFERQPDNYYPGLNAVTMLTQRGTPEDKRELKQLLPRVKQALDSRIADKPPDYWDLASGVQLSAVGRQWSAAQTWAGRLLQASPTSWMLASTIQELQAISHTLPETDRDKLARLIRPLEQKLTAGNA